MNPTFRSRMFSKQNGRRCAVSTSLVSVLALALACGLPLPAQEGTGDENLAEQLASIPAKEPAEALKSFKIEHGFGLQAVATEPLVVDPVDACFDADGRMYVVEMRDYPFLPEQRPEKNVQEKPTVFGTVRLLTDTDDDGTFDESSVFAEELRWPQSVCCYDGGVFVLAPPMLYYLKDTDGDGKADVRQVLIDGFNLSNVQALANNLKWGLNNRIYAAGGRTGAELRKRGEALFQLSRRDFSFDPQTEEFRQELGGEQFGHSFDDFGSRFVCNNSNHIEQIIYDARDVDRSPWLSVPGQIRSIAKEGSAAVVFRTSAPEPWRVIRTARRAADPKYNTRLPKTELVATGYFTSATGITVYRGGAYPEPFQGNVFIGDVGGNLVHRKRLLPNGAGYLAERADENVEFLTSTDNWFRPANFVNAPDGTLYILDMYRETIEHPASLPEDIKAHLNLESGRDRGRIYRLVPPDFERTAPPKLSGATNAELVSHLGSPNAWVRETAQRLLWERQADDVTAALAEMAANGPSPASRVHALWTLQGVGQLSAEHALTGLKDPAPEVRRHAVRLAEPFAADNPDVLAEILTRRGDDDDLVRFQVACSLGELPVSAVTDAWREWITMSGLSNDERYALLSSVGGNAATYAESILQAPAGAKNTSTVLNILLTAVATQGGINEIARLMDGALGDGVSEPLRFAAVDALGEGLRRNGKSLMAILGDSRFPQATREKVLALFDQAAEISLDGDRPLSARLAAVKLLAYVNYPAAEEVVEELLLPQTPQPLQLAAMNVLGAHASPGVYELLLENWSSFSPTARSVVVDVLTQSADRAAALLDAVSNGDVKTAEIAPDKRQALLSHPSKSIRQVAAKVLSAASDADRQKLIEQYKPTLAEQGDPARGLQVFQKQCLKCHRLNNEGFVVGPDITSVSNKSDEDLLISILDPNREAQPNFLSYSAVTLQGKVATGMIVAETPTSLTLRRAGGEETLLQRDQIDELNANGISMMPVGLEREVNPQQMADVIAFIRTLTPAAKK